MSDSVYDDGARKARVEVLRLKGVSVSMITDEQIAKGKAKNENFKPSASFKVEWEPLSYRIEGGKYGNSRVEYLPFTFGLTPEEVEAVRTGLWRGAGNTGKRMTIPANLSGAKDVWTVFMVKAHAAGLDISIAENGDVYTKDVDQVFECEAGQLTLPRRIKDNNGKWRDSVPGKVTSEYPMGEPSYNPYARIPTRKLTDYVQPDDVPVILITTDDTDDTPAEAATTTSGSVSGVTAEALADAFAEAGLIGASTTTVDTAPKQVNITNKFGSRAPIFFLSEVQKAAANGDLITYAVEKGAIAVLNGVIEKAGA